MGYDIRISGSINFEPHIIGLISLLTVGAVQFDTSRHPRSIGETPIARAIVSSGMGRPDEDEILGGTQAMLEVIMNNTNGNAIFTGYLECQGEETGDLWRVYVRNGQAVRVDPKIVWPDEP